VAVGAAFPKPAVIITSEDGNHWVEVPFVPPVVQPDNRGPELELDDVIFAEGVFLAVGESEVMNKSFIFTSLDGVNWKERFSPTRRRLRGAAYGGGTFVVVGNNEAILHARTEPVLYDAFVEGSQIIFSAAVHSLSTGTYSVQDSADLRFWTPIPELMNKTAPMVEVPVRNDERQRFFRLVVP
jgi:hypothetical protein